jgi:hypothetical protein
MKDHRLLDGIAVRDRILDKIAEQVRDASGANTARRCWMTPTAPACGLSS